MYKRDLLKRRGCGVGGRAPPRADRSHPSGRIGPVSTGPGGALPLIHSFSFPFLQNNLARCSTRKSRSVPYAILHASMAPYHALTDNLIARSSVIALSGHSVAHHSALRILGCGDQAGRWRWTLAFHGLPSLSPNSRTGTRLGEGYRAHFCRVRCTDG